MSAPVLTMSKQEFERAVLLRKVLDKRLTQRKAAEILGLSLRQVERLCRRYRTAGPAALASRRRGRVSNHRAAASHRQSVLGLVRARYADFGPTLAREKLRECHGLEVSKETLRKWMTEDGLWVPHARRRDRVQQPRNRRTCLGELIQIDGCDHEWFEERAARCTLLVYVDDATSRLMQLHFCDSESTFTYFEATRGYLDSHGKPVAFYSDKYSVFRVNQPEPRGGDGVTQFGRALNELNIDIICANSPAAKGRVERANLTLQDRLVKELRLQGISSIAEANAFAPTFLADYNARFAKAPSNAFDAHRPMLPSEKLDDIFTWQETRRVSRSLSFNYQRKLFLLQETDVTRALAGQRVTVFELDDGTVQVRHGSKVLPATQFGREDADITQGAIVSNKLLAGVLQHIKDKQTKKDSDKFDKLRTHREKRLLLQRAKAVA
ncbi:MAG TPA: ISNCY family transposase [Candidatus Limnocylindrales bacterium]|nr:ISNCY family transposase [Candidatus Limnocylindrales bacterium]